MVSPYYQEMDVIEMKYCTKCKKLYTTDELTACRLCGKALITDPHHHSPVDIITANGFELERIKAALTEADIPFSVRECENDTGLQILNSAPPENSHITIPLSYYTQAMELLVGIGAIKEAEELNASDEEKLQQERQNFEEEMSPRKTFWVKLLSIILFIGLIALVVFVADWIGRFINPNFH